MVDLYKQPGTDLNRFFELRGQAQAFDTAQAQLMSLVEILMEAQDGNEQ